MTDHIELTACISLLRVPWREKLIWWWLGRNAHSGRRWMLCVGPLLLMLDSFPQFYQRQAFATNDIMESKEPHCRCRTWTAEELKDERLRNFMIRNRKDMLALLVTANAIFPSQLSARLLDEWKSENAKVNAKDK